MALSLPSMPGNADYSDTASWLASVSDAVANEALAFITSLTAQKDSDYFSVGDIPSFFEPIFYAGGLSEQAYVRPTRPDMTPPSIAALVSHLNSLVLPDAPTLVFEYTDPGYASALRDPMISKLLADLLNGGYGIEPADELALWNRERDREAAAMLANIEEIKRQAASTSFPMPQSSLYNALRKAQQEYQNKTSSVNRDIGLKRADMYVEQRRKVIEQVLASETQNIALYNAIQGRGLEIAKTEIAMAISLFEAGIRAIELEYASVMKQIEAQMEFSKTAALVYNADVNLYQVYVNALIADSQALIQNQRNTLDRDKTKLFASAEQVRFRLQQLAMTVENTKDINKTGADFFRTGFGSALNGVNGLAVQSTEL